ncbi:MAG: hypothetical protein WC959_01940 [Kiritimatiellales bacterium]
MKNIVFIGGWGHWFEAANEFGACGDVHFSGVAPAYAGEELSGGLNHPSLAGITVFSSCEDSCAGIFTLSSGAPATVSVDYFCPQSAGTHGNDWIRIVGTAGIIEARANENLVTLLKDGKTPVPVELDIPPPLYLPFVEKNTALTNTVDALKLTRFVLRARQSADECSIINIQQLTGNEQRLETVFIWSNEH